MRFWAQFLQQDRANPLGGAPVAVGVHGACHLRVGVGVDQQARGLLHNLRAVCADQFGCARRHAFGTLGRLAQHQNRLAKRGRLLLHAA